MKVIVLRWGHRPRDLRVTSHVALTARAFGASGLVLADTKDKSIESTVNKIVGRWGGSFELEMDVPWRSYVRSWKKKGGTTVHLTVYGENIQTSDVIHRIKKTKKDLLVLVGSQKVPSEFYDEDISDFNVAVGNQPHSEISSLAIFLHQLFGGEELCREFRNAKLRVIPSNRGKRIISE